MCPVVLLYTTGPGLSPTPRNGNDRLLLEVEKTYRLTRGIENICSTIASRFGAIRICAEKVGIPAIKTIIRVYAVREVPPQYLIDRLLPLFLWIIFPPKHRPRQKETIDNKNICSTMSSRPIADFYHVQLATARVHQVLAQACAIGDIDRVTELISQPEQPPQYLQRGLLSAIHNRKLDVVRLLLREGAMVVEGRWRLHWQWPSRLTFLRSWSRMAGM